MRMQPGVTGGGRPTGWTSVVAGTALAVGMLGAMSSVSLAQPARQLDPAAVEETESLIAEILAGLDSEGSLQAYWASTFPTFSDEPYHDPQGGFYPYETGEASGGACWERAGDAVRNAAYCLDDESITYDVRWLARLYQDRGAVGPITVLAHEWGHHIQVLAGEPKTSKAAELQADCYAGMYLGSLVDRGTIWPADVVDGLAFTSSLGDEPDDFSDWRDPDVHGEANERRQAEGIGYSTGEGSYCAAYTRWRDRPAVELFGDKSIRLEPFGKPVAEEDGSYSLELPEAWVIVREDDLATVSSAADALRRALEGALPATPDWDIAEPQDGWLEVMGWGTGSGATTTFSGTWEDGRIAGGAAAMQIDPDGSALLYVALGADQRDAVVATGQGQKALAALAWGYCDPDAAVTANCPG
jgi:uncharacterized protein